MRRCLILPLMSLAACGSEPPSPTLRPTAEMADTAPLADATLFRPCPGWEGAPPATEREILLAAEAEMAGRLRCNGQLLTLGRIYGLPQ